MSEESVTWGVWKDGFGFLKDDRGEVSRFTMLDAQARAVELRQKDSTASYSARLITAEALGLK